MDQATQHRSAFFTHDPVCYGEQDTVSILEALYVDYIEQNPIRNTELLNQYNRVSRSLPELDTEKFDAIFGEISKLSMLHETLGFQAGVKVGLRLALELLE